MKKKRNLIRGLGLLICLVTLCGSLPVMAADRKVTITEKEYAVTIDGAYNLFMSNEKPVSGEVGTKVFLTYTVEKVTSNLAAQNGVIAAKSNTEAFPYTADNHGTMRFDQKSVLYEEGYTYVFRFERTKSGFEYECAKMKGDEAVSFQFEHATASSKDDDYNYFGVWTAPTKEGRVSAVLNHVRCYDEKGNDLGIHFNNETGYKNDELNALLDVHPTIKSSYSFELEDALQVAVSNKYPLDGDVMYMEYEVEEATKDNSIQHGMISTGQPTIQWPFQYGKGYLLLNVYEKDEADKLLLKEGGKYFICVQRKEDAFVSYVQRTLNGKTETFTFEERTGTYNEAHSYFCLWLYGPVSASLKNVKCYDGKGNNLGVQLNRTDVPLSHVGELEDYSKSQAVYYCKENNTLLELADKKNVTIKKDATEETGTYSIQNGKDLYLVLGEGKVAYSYNPLIIKDEDGNEYKRLREYTVKFVTGDEVLEASAKAENGYRVEEPEKPSKEGNTFKGWYLGDGTAFDFETIISESITLYAKWQDGEGNEYLAANTEIEVVKDYSMAIAIAAAGVLAVAAAAGCIIIVRRKKTNEEKANK